MKCFPHLFHQRNQRKTQQGRYFLKISYTTLQTSTCEQFDEKLVGRLKSEVWQHAGKSAY